MVSTCLSDSVRSFLYRSVCLIYGCRMTYLWEKMKLYFETRFDQRFTGMIGVMTEILKWPEIKPVRYRSGSWKCA